MSTLATQEILQHYNHESPGVRGNLYRLLSQGRLGGTGRMLVLPVDQGVEHGPARSFANNPDGYDPLYHWRLAIDAGLSAFAAPLGFIEAGAPAFSGQIPTILKVNNANSHGVSAQQAMTASVDDALRLGCAAVGYTLYPGSEHDVHMCQQLRELVREARAVGLPTVVWSYPRGGNLSKQAETGLDVIAYAAHIAAQMGAHIIKVKPPTDHVDQPEAKSPYGGQDWSALSDRIAHIMQSAFGGKRIVIFSGGAAKKTDALLDEIRAIHKGGGNGSIIGRNAFQKPKGEAMALLDQIMGIYGGPSDEATQARAA